MPGRRDERHFEPALAAHPDDRVGGVPASDELSREREAGVHMARRPSPGDHGERLAHRARERAGASLASDVQEETSRRHGGDQCRSTERHERQRQPRDGKQADDGADVDDRLHEHPDRHARGDQHAEAIGRAAGRLQAEDPEREEQGHDDEAPDEAELLSDDREDEVGVRLRQEAPLGRGSRRDRPRRCHRTRRRRATASSGTRGSTGRPRGGGTRAAGRDGRARSWSGTSLRPPSRRLPGRGARAEFPR